jgi:quercetin dioxygenase-like cupin family protein
MTGTVRRIVTGHDANGAAVVTSDAAAPVVLAPPQRPGYALTQIWATSASPAPIGNAPDPTLQPLTLATPRNGTVIRIIEFPPESQAAVAFDAGAARSAFAAIGGAEASTFAKDAPHPMMHRTESIDYGIVLAGEITLVLDKEEVVVRAGDVVIQRGTNHAWSNRSGAPCRMAFILIDGTFDPVLAAQFAIQGSPA